MGIIMPAIDLLEGRAVRLCKGDYAQKTEYGDPLQAARDFKDMGAAMLHVVDLDGAKSGGQPNFEIVRQIAEIIPIEVGGGVRTAETAAAYLRFARRVIFGTIAVEKPSFVREMVARHGADSIVVGVDVRDGKVATKGWLEDSGLPYLDFIDSLPVRTIIVTDIAKDGTLTAPNWALYERIRGKDVIVSGGVASNEDVIAAKKYAGVIVGKAYYEGKVDLKWLLKNA